MQTEVTRRENDSASGGGQELGTALNIHANKGRITVFVKSKNMCVGTRTINLLQANNGLTPSVVAVPRRIPVYERVLDDDQKAVLEMATEQARVSGASLEVKDEGKLGLARLLDMISGHRLLPGVPFVSYSGNVKPLTYDPRYINCESAAKLA